MYVEKANMVKFRHNNTMKDRESYPWTRKAYYPPTHTKTLRCFPVSFRSKPISETSINCGF